MIAKKQHIERKRVILLLGVMTLCYALLMPDSRQMPANFVKLLTSPTQLMTDFFALAGLSATFVNAAGHFFLAHYLMSRNERSNINGLQVGAVGIFVGHSLFGTNLFNVLPIILGMVLYARWTHQSFKLYTTVSLFATSMAPIVSYVAFHQGGTVWSLLLAVVVGVGLGFIAPALAEEFLKFHHGLTLYNYGFTTGIISTFLVLFLPYFKAEAIGPSLVSQGYHTYLLVYFLLIWGLFLILALSHWTQAIGQFGALIGSTGRTPSDFVSKFGLYTALLNMCATSGLYLVWVLLLGLELNGPILGGLLTIMGFSAFGKHPRNTLPVGLGITLAASFLGNPLNDLRFALALLFSTGLSPVAGFYGLGYGVVAGFLHYNLSATVLQLHQGLSLYNNGFSTGFVAAFLGPIIDTYQDHRDKWFQRQKG